MSIYDKASLVLIPSGTKTSKVYSQKPTNGDGDFTFSRSTAATRVNASGNIEKETQNLLLQSNTFDTTWLNAATTETGGQLGYDGTNDAWRIDKSNSGAYIIQIINASGVNTFSVYAKAGSLNWLRLNINFTSGTDPIVYFDLANGLIGSTPAGQIDAKIEDVGGGWYRCSVSGNGTIQDVRFFPADGDNDVSGTSGNIYIQDAQLNQGLIAQEVITTTTSAIYGGITDNVPRLDYTDSSCPALLLEPQRTNGITQSEYSGVYSTQLLLSITDNFAISPEGYNNAFRVIPDTTNNQHIFYRSGMGGAANTYTQSIFAKANGYNFCYIRFDLPTKYAFFDLQNGTTAYADSGITSTITNFGNGWYRCTATMTTTNYANAVIGIAAAGDTQADRNLAGDGTSSVLFYGHQSELGSYATSYIPTYGSAVTRNTEPNAVDKVDLVTDGFFSSTELTWFVDVDLYERDGGTTVAPRLISSSNSQVFIGFNTGAAGTFFSIRHKDGTTALNTSSISFDENGQRIKVLVKISGTTGKAFINGTSVGTFTTLAASNYDVFDNTQNNPYNINKLLLFPTALTDQEAIDLTTI